MILPSEHLVWELLSTVAVNFYVSKGSEIVTLGPSSEVLLRSSYICGELKTVNNTLIKEGAKTSRQIRNTLSVFLHTLAI